MPHKTILAALLCLGLAAEAAAQTTGMPVYLAPYRAFKRYEFGATLADPGPGFALEGFYRYGDRRNDFGFRAGLWDIDGSTAFLAGVDFRTRVVVINKDPGTSYSVKLQVSGLTGPANLSWLQAPGVSSTSGVTLGGQTFGLATSTGALPAPRLEPVSQLLGWYTIQMPPYSAALLTR